MAGTATSYQFEDRHEERGDIIQFYNQVFVDKVKAFVSRFSKGDVSSVRFGRATTILLVFRLTHTVVI